MPNRSCCAGGGNGASVPSSSDRVDSKLTFVGLAYQAMR